METIFISLGILSVLVFIVTTMMIYSYLKDKGKKVSFLWIRLFMISYANKYKKLTKEETGKTGYLFYLWIISINIALISAILILLIQ